MLENQFASVWSDVPSADKVFKRLIVSGEVALRQMFLRGLAVSGKVDNLDFRASDPTSDWAQITQRLESAVEMLKAEEERKAAEQAEAAKKAAQEAAARDEEQKTDLELEQLFSPQWPGERAAAASAQGQDDDPGSGEALHQDSWTEKEGKTEGEEKKEEKQEEKNEEKNEEAGQENQALGEVRRRAYVAIDDVMRLYDRIWKSGQPPPPALNPVVRGTVFVAPTPSTSRGLPQSAMKVLRGKAYDVLELFDVGCAVIVGVGHEPEQKNAVRTRLEQINVEFKKCKWEMFPVFQTLGPHHYVEYFLWGSGPEFPKLSGNLSWIGPTVGAPDKAARMIFCPKGGNQITQELEETGQVCWCDCTNMVRQRFLVVLPKISTKKKRTQEDELMGGVADDDSDKDSVASSDSDDQGKGAEEDEVPKASSPPASSQGHVAAKDNLAKLRPSRQGPAASTWLQILNAFCPSQVVLAGPLQFQTGLLHAVLQYNDQRFGLAQCPFIGFCAEPPVSPTETEWTQKHVKSWQTTHLTLHTIDRMIHAYVRSLFEAMQENQRGLGMRRGSGKALRVLKKQGTDTSASAADHVEQTETGQVPVNHFIMAHGNHGKDRTLLAPPVPGNPEEDSDDPDGDAPSNDLSQAALSKRNGRFLSKHNLRVQLSTEESGHGLFAVSDVPVGMGLSSPCSRHPRLLSQGRRGRGRGSSSGRRRVQCS